jgi:hypothetical protein
LTTPSGATLDVRRLQIAVDDPVFVCGFERVGDLPRDRMVSSSGMAPRRSDRPASHLDELEDQHGNGGSAGDLLFLEAVDRGDVRVSQRGEHLRSR